jgi:hypothetical protein
MQLTLFHCFSWLSVIFDYRLGVIEEELLVVGNFLTFKIRVLLTYLVRI